ncbi:substrate-binding domain-containing protein [Domibacillus sp. DTU_2020_1001157_1_SI_ALB_TIR_016]|uniref:LacI family DNA-binding transcriptional regulator n=1 Tax=Domibacillus sp. DTU_2020_1001157_1_SI_ALB_TIR_016 TaxID=3077789 RepID=UPI0028E411FF|nr:substrate-binding domain-containing protein [Domibacillus sp. DTU_2020_1001157_1_SI_ALB_TIR_016]WNS81426.1 substrate-binding domain-containing protein [Domibacillus sp. DTU_2020_1001157_1_SI_ALB_TIR_016]
MKRVTMADVAKEAGVSKSTVSQFLNGRFEYMSEDTKKKIERAVQDLSYSPNVIARSLKQKRTSMIGIIVANIVHGISTEVCQAIEDYCQKKDIHAIVCNAYDDPEKEKKYIDMLRARQVDGLIIFPSGGNQELYRQLEKEKYPIVFVDRKIEGVEVSTIVVDNRRAVRQAVEYLVEKKHDRIALVTPPMTTYTRRERLEGYKEAIEARGLPFQDQYVKSVPYEAIVPSMKEMFQQHPPTALIAANDLSFMEVMKFAKENNLKIGQDLALIVFDNIKFADIYEPAITTISQPAYEMGTRAAELLIQQIMKKPVTPETHVLETSLLIRDSAQ